MEPAHSIPRVGAITIHKMHHEHWKLIRIDCRVMPNTYSWQAYQRFDKWYSFYDTGWHDKLALSMNWNTKIRIPPPDAHPDYRCQILIQSSEKHWHWYMNSQDFYCNKTNIIHTVTSETETDLGLFASWNINTIVTEYDLTLMTTMLVQVQALRRNGRRKGRHGRLKIHLRVFMLRTSNAASDSYYI